MSLTGPEVGRARVLVTGADGFVGRRLTAAMAERRPNWIVTAAGGPQGPGGLDVVDPDAVTAMVERARPDVVVHLAAVAAVTDSVRDPRHTWRVNMDGVLNLVLALQARAPDAHLLFVSSAEVYGESLNTAAAVDEQALLQPVNPYAASKAAADILVRQSAACGLSATVARPFNHIGPGQSEAFVAPNFAAQVARIEQGRQAPVISVGALDDERDFLDVGDVVDAYLLMLDRRAELGRGTVLNVASGAPVRIGDILERFLSLSRVRIEVKVDPDRLRPSVVKRVAGDASRLRALGWAPRVSLADTLAAVLEEKRREAASV
ncbi:MAG: GDP-mannose 4,6-dehydratase [Caulobacteraceae bacterium]